MPDTLTAPAVTGDTATGTVPRLSHGDGDHDLFAHVVDQGRFNLASAYIEGTAVEAICGKKWTPTRDPKRFPMCPACKDILDAHGIPVPGS